LYTSICQQNEEDKQIVDFAPLEKFLRTPMLSNASHMRAVQIWVRQTQNLLETSRVVS